MHKRILLIVLPLLALVGVILVGARLPMGNAAAASDDRQFAPPRDAQPAYTGYNPYAGPPGIYVFYDWQNLDPNLYPIQGGGIITPWRDGNPAQGVYDWTYTDGEIRRLDSRGKSAVLRFNAYDGEHWGGSYTPAWLKQQAPSSVLYCSGVEIPRWWDTNFQRAWRDFILAAGQRYNNDPRVAWV